MKTRKALILAFIGAAFILLISFAPPPNQAGIPAYEMQPPHATGFWVRKLQTPLQNGNNMVVMVKYDEWEQMPPVLNIYDANNGNPAITLSDDGQNADAVAGDSIYSGYITENIQLFESTMINNSNSLAQTGSFIKFTGHSGTRVMTNGVLFDAAAFESNEAVPIHEGVLIRSTCDVAKEKSLFITDLSVVEDPGRTFKITAADTNIGGNQRGLYTFGNLFKGIANASNDKATAKFIKSWLRNWTRDTTINGQFVPARTDVFNYLIAP